MELLGDPERCQVVLVTLPETTPVNEVIETTATLVDRVGVRLGPVVINAVDARTDVPDPTTMKLGRGADANALRAAAVFRRARRAMQDAEIARLEQSITTPVDRARVAAGGRPRPPTTSATLAASLATVADTRVSTLDTPAPRRDGRRVLRLRRCRQDDDRGRDRHRAGAARPTGRRRHDRSGAPPRRRARPEPTGSAPNRSGSTSTCPASCGR